MFKKKKYLTWEEFQERSNLLEEIEEAGGFASSNHIIIKFNNKGIYFIGGSCKVRDVHKHFNKIREEIDNGL